jgi:hypothetical protein
MNAERLGNQVKVKVTLWLTVSQSVSLCVKPHLGLMTSYLLLFNSYSLVFLGRSLWREDESVVYNCCWLSPAQSFSGPSPMELATIFYCLRFETSLFVASYYSQGDGGGIRHRLHTGRLGKVKVKVTLRLMVGQSVSLGVEPNLGLMTRYVLLFWQYGLVFVGRPLWREDGSVFCIWCWSSPAQSFSGPSPLDLATILYCLCFETSLFVASYDSQGHGGGIRPRLHTGRLGKKLNCFIISGRTEYKSLCITVSLLFFCPLYIRYSGNVFTEPLPSNWLFRVYSLQLEYAYRTVA